MRRIYLDHNASTPLLPEAARAMARFGSESPGNPSSVHLSGRLARAELESVRRQLGQRLGCDPRGWIFTSGATEANNLALRGVLEAGGGGHLVISAVEHSSIARTADWLQGQGVDVTRVGVDADGLVDVDGVAAALRPDTRLVSVMAANHETGVLQPLAAVARRTRAAGVPLHADAAQAVGRVTIDAEETGLDLLTLSGHKLGGPTGIGALWVRQEIEIAPLLLGGGQESTRRSGTENVLGAVGLAAALEAAPWPALAEKVRRLLDRLESGLLGLWPGAVVHGAGARRLPNTASIGFPGLDGEAAVMRLDLEGIAVSLGSACTAGAMTPSPVLRAMGASEELARGSIRFSLGRDSSEDEVDETVRVFQNAVAPARLAPAGGMEVG